MLQSVFFSSSSVPFIPVCGDRHTQQYQLICSADSVRRSIIVLSVMPVIAGHLSGSAAACGMQTCTARTVPALSDRLLYTGCRTKLPRILCHCFGVRHGVCAVLSLLRGAIYAVDTCCQYSLSMLGVNACCRCLLSVLVVGACCRCLLSMLAVNACCRCLLSVCVWSVHGVQTLLSFHDAESVMFPHDVDSALSVPAVVRVCRCK